MPTIQDKWEEFAASVVDPMMSAEHLRLLRCCFFAGATSLLQAQADVFSYESPEDAFALMDRLNDECLEFVREMKGRMTN